MNRCFELKLLVLEESKCETGKEYASKIESNAALRLARRSESTAAQKSLYSLVPFAIIKLIPSKSMTRVSDTKNSEGRCEFELSNKAFINVKLIGLICNLK